MFFHIKNISFQINMYLHIVRHNNKKIYQSF